MQETKFINFTLKFPQELYHDSDLPPIEEIFLWMEQLAKSSHIKWGVSYNPERSSFIASYTDRGGKTTEPNPCVTAFGGTMLSAYQKLYVMVEVLGLREYGETIARENQDAIETAISKQLMKAMGR